MFDRLGKKIAKTGQSAMQKTKGFTDEVRLNGLIAEQEKQSNRLLHQLGSSYYERYASSPLPEFADTVRSIKDTYEAIEEYREQIRRLKNLKACPDCGMEMPYDSQFCARCGKPMKNQESASRNAAGNSQCPSCGTALLPDAVFCNFCGMRITAPEPKPQEAKCPACGAKVLPDTFFCNICGQKLAAINTAPEAEPPLPRETIYEERVPEAVGNEATYDEWFGQTVLIEPERPAAAENTCAFCGASLVSDALFCLSCGNAVKTETEDTEPAVPDVCTGCGESLIPGAAFCLGCGKSVHEAEASPGKPLFCLQCGEELVEDAAFCLKCGKKV